MSVDMKWVYDGYEAFVNSEIVRNVGTNRMMGLWYGRVVSTTKFMNMTPRKYRTDSDGFFRKIEKMGEAEYTREIVNRYFLILKFDEEMRKTENKGIKEEIPSAPNGDRGILLYMSSHTLVELMGHAWILGCPRRENHWCYSGYTSVSLNSA